MTAVPIAQCPFCGDSTRVVDKIDLGIYAVCCNDCKTIGPHRDGEQTEEDAIRRWNERVNPVNDQPTITAVDIENLRHMLGVAANEPRRFWGTRNHFAPGAVDLPSMVRLEAAGLVRQGRPYEDAHYYHATEQGCAVAGLDRKQTRRATT